MEIIKVADLPFVKNGWGVQGKQVVDLPKVGIINLVLQPGEQVPLHKTPVDVLFQVVEGEGTVTIGEENQVVETGDIIVSPAQIPHGLAADQGCAFSFYVIKVPNTQKSAIPKDEYIMLTPRGRQHKHRRSKRMEPAGSIIICLRILLWFIF